jgi:hypothetical protein
MIGKLLLTLTCSGHTFPSQFLIIWSGSLSGDTLWYLKRSRADGESWAEPVLPTSPALRTLLSRDLKRNYRKLVVIAALVMVMRLVDLVWLVAPQYGHLAISQIWVYVLLPLGLGGIWLWYFVRQLESRPLVPVGDPNLEHAIAPEHGHGEFQPEH